VTIHNGIEVEREKGQLIHALDQLLQLAKERSSPRLEEQARKLGEKLKKFTFNLVVLGEFKRGKSTLINALVGASLLPTATIPLTSVATILRFGKANKVTAKLCDGRVVDAMIENLPDLVTEKGNPKNVQGIAVVEIEYSAKILEEGIRIVDTPGTGSVYVHNTQTTYDFLPEADAAIFVFVADQPATRAELDLLKASRAFSTRHFFVLNKIDHLDEEGSRESLSFLRDTLKAELQEEPNIFAVSAKKALAAKEEAGTDMDAGFAELEQALLEFTLKDKASTLVDSVKRKLESLIDETEQLIAVERSSMAMPRNGLDSCLNALTKAKGEIFREQQDAEFIVKGEIQKLVKVIENDLQPVVADNESSLQNSMKEEFEKHQSLETEALIEHLQTILKAHIANIFDTWRRAEDPKVQKSFQFLNGRFAEKGNEIIATIESLTSDLFQTKVTSVFEQGDLQSSSKHRYAVDNPFTLSIEMLPLLLPSVLSKQVIRGRFIEAAKQELPRNSGRLRADYQERLEASAKAFLQNFKITTSQALEEIEMIVNRAIEQQSSTAEVKDIAEQRLAAQEAQLGLIKALIAEGQL
jgi:GTP-binding protein EngB required for normal cell division